MNLTKRLRNLLLAGGALLAGSSFVLSYRRDIPAETLEREYTDENSDFLPLRGQDIHYRVSGEGDRLLLIHGTASSLQTWSGWCEQLESSYRLIRPDLPGFGLTGPPRDEDYSPSRYLEVLESFVDELKLDDFSVVGNAFGGYLGLRYALRHPDQIKKLVLLNSMGLQDQWPVPLRFGQYPMIDKMKRFTPKVLVRGLLRHVFGDPDKVTGDMVNRYYDLLLREGNRDALMNFLRQTGKDNGESLNLSGQLGQLKSPVLIQWGLRDPWLPVSHAERFREAIPQTSVVTYLTAGHVPMEEIPRQTAQDARAFLSS